MLKFDESLQMLKSQGKMGFLTSIKVLVAEVGKVLHSCSFEGLTHWSRQEGLIPSSRGSLAGSPVVDLLHKETSRDS
ncbi:hypothetical protein HanHA300_Chr14g0510721 [Helianthus annuus]|nr:hypothetical protein HanHA300_Chr14g0510721 [Helianthus annuus]KAJ0484400.1 hypothetical protein HanHA89_Chr14g0543671 [Helianthus annuus]KAJ0654952.1 hypothetical protein HanLR1_Chr14g0512931 [Helianthus annuus]KAJ0658672.1 hypothetical protein HanOQP8_Chr14g0510841 [Helianthus annuus]